MKKTSSVIKKQNLYELVVLIQDTALMSTINGATGLIDVKSNKIVGDFGWFNTTYDCQNGFFFQTSIQNAASAPLRIYDAIEKKMLAEDCIVTYMASGDYGLIIIKNPQTGKCFLFDIKSFRTNPEIFNNGYDNIEWILDYYGEDFFVFSNGSKKGLYTTKHGLIEPVEYDNIDIRKNFIIYTKGSNKFFTCMSGDKIQTKSPMFEEISFEPTDNTIIYCKRESGISIYKLESCGTKLLFDVPDCDEINYAHVQQSNDKETYWFIGQEKHKYGIFNIVYNYDQSKNSSFTQVLENSYDNIQYTTYNGIFFLHSNQKRGLFKELWQKSFLLEAKYDNVMACMYECYILVNGGSCDIITSYLREKPLVRDCKIIEILKDRIIFEKNGKKGIIFLKHNNCSIINQLDDVTLLDDSLFRIEVDGKFGMVLNGEKVIEPKHNQIDVHFAEKEDGLRRNVHFSIKKEDGTYELVKYEISKFNSSMIPAKFLSTIDFEDVKLYEHIMVCQDKTNVYVYNYENTLLKTFPADAKIMPVQDSVEFQEAAVFTVDDVYYFYTNGHFEKLTFEVYNLYITAYESKYGIVVVNDTSLEGHDRKCTEIENVKAAQVDATLLSIYKGNKDLQDKYPQLVKKKKL